MEEKEEENDKKKNVKYRRSGWWKKAKERIAMFFCGEEERRRERRTERVTNAPERDKSWGSLEDPHFLLLMANNSLCVNATAEGLQERTEIMERWQQQQQAHVKESRRVEEIPQRWKEPKGEDRTKMNKEAKMMRCTSLNGSVWSSERKYTRRYKGKYDIFSGIEHRLRKEAMVEQFNKEAQEGLRFASDAARITDERASIEDQKHTPVFLQRSTATWEQL